MLNEKEITRISKFLSLVLRHKPETIGIILDENGWTPVTILIEKLAITGTQIDIDILKHVVDTNAKKRFAFNNTFDRIRASQGHSITIELGYEQQVPPEILYHGTAAQHIESILSTGLNKGSRHQVHLSADTTTAINVGKRHGKPVVLEVAAGKMHNDGFIFFVSENNVWLTDNVPPGYLSIKL
jgi:putative RNA 2'-phosphotransferase